MVTDAWDVLHRISSITSLDPGEPEEGDSVRWGEGVSVCGIEGEFEMPGLFSRMGRPRCTACCDLLGVPHGDGAPYNHADVPWQNA